MNEEEMKKFLEELKDSGGDLDYWSKRKDRENASFYGFETDPEKVKRLNMVKNLCAQLAQLDEVIHYKDEPLTNRNRNGDVRISLPPLFFTTDQRVSEILSKCFALSDHFTIAAPRLIDDEAEDDDFVGDRSGREVLITFIVADMWKTFGKAPFI